MKLIKLTQGKFAQVDDADFEWLNQWKWFAAKRKHTYYAGRIISKPFQDTILLHRFIMDTPKGVEVDHVDHNGLNCQRHNMRNCKHSQNVANKIPSGRSKYLGVFYNGNYIRAHIQVNGNKIHLGYHATEENAARAYDKAARIHHKEFANLNFK